MSLLLDFADPALADVAVGGGKGASLARLTQRGFPVPPGVVVTPEAYRVFAAPAAGEVAALAGLGAGDLAAIRAASERLLATLAALRIPSPLERAVREWHAASGGGHAFAVRSSGTMEDLAGAAFAGQHDTFLNCVGADEILARVRDCWLSLWHERAIAYRARMGFDHAEVAMAVVVQRMVRSDVAGVAFSMNPVTGALDQAVIDANFGLGESVVSGDGEVDHFVVDRSTGRAIEARIAPKRTRVVPGGRGTEERHVSDEEALRPTLGAGELARITALLGAVEESFGWPQDTEWGIERGELWLLQSRPVTTIPPRWTRDESAERFPDPVTPLTWDFVETGFHRSLNHSFALMGLPPYDGKWFALFGCYVYGNQNAVELYARRSPAAVRALGELEALLPSLLQRFAWVATLPERWRAALPGYLAAIDALLAEPLDGLDVPALWAYIERVNRLGTEYFLPNIAISIGHGLLHRSLHALLRMAMDEADAERTHALLIACDTMTTRVNAELRALAALARADDALARRLRETDSRALLATAPDAGTSDPFWRELHRFVEAHGHRETDFDAYHPTWREAPWVVLDHVRALVDAPDAGATVGAAAERAAAEAALLARTPAPMREFVATVVRLAREYTALDDLEHYHTTRLALPMRRGVRALGERLVAMGVLADPMDPFFARRDALARAVAAGSPDEWSRLARAIADAKEEYRAARERAPEWVLGEREPEPVTGDVLEGIAGSPGVADGPVFIVRGVEDFPRFPRGAVLVARTTNPAWTPLFHGAAAVITESGGPLSHGAVTAREMRIPAVMAVRGALGALADGERVRVDGTGGRVVRLDVHGAVAR